MPSHIRWAREPGLNVAAGDGDGPPPWLTDGCYTKSFTLPLHEVSTAKQMNTASESTPVAIESQPDSFGAGIPVLEDDMKVEDLVIHLTVHRFSAEADRFKDKLFAEMDKEFLEQVQLLAKLSHEKENVGAVPVPGEEQEGKEKANPSKAKSNTARSRAPTTTTTNRAAAPSAPLRVVVLAGPHKGEAFRLEVRAGKQSAVGRSRAAKVRNNGVSLFRDGEVSTAHGHFGLDPVDNQIYYVDNGSSNGSFLVDSEDDMMDPTKRKNVEEQIRIHDQVLLVLGVSLLRLELAVN